MDIIGWIHGNSWDHVQLQQVFISLLWELDIFKSSAEKLLLLAGGLSGQLELWKTHF